MKMAVVKTGGKQYLINVGSELFVEHIDGKQGDSIELEKLAEIESDKGNIKLGTPVLKESVKAELVESVKGDKIRVARFKAKSRYRKVKGFRPQLTKIKIVSI